MNTETMSSRNMKSMLILIVLCGSHINAAFTVGQDIWIAILAEGVLYLPLLLIWSRIHSLYPQMNLYDVIEALFGRVLGAVLVLLLSAWALMVTALRLRSFVEFTVAISLQDSPRIPLMIFLMIPVIYLAQKGYQVIGRWSIILCVAILGNVAVTILLAMNVIDFKHMLPVLDHTPAQIFSDAFSMGAISVGETLMAMTAYVEYKQGEKSRKTYVIGCLMGVGALSVVALRDLLILGLSTMRVAQFPTYMSVRVIRVGDFLERVESTVSFALILMGMTKMTVLLTGTSMGVARVLRVQDYKKLVLPMGLLALAVCSVLFKNFLELLDFVELHKYISLPFQVLIPVIVWIMAEVNARKRKGILEG